MGIRMHACLGVFFVSDNGLLLLAFEWSNILHAAANIICHVSPKVFRTGMCGCLEGAAFLLKLMAHC